MDIPWFLWLPRLLLGPPLQFHLHMRLFVTVAITAAFLSLLSMWLGETFLDARIPLLGSFAGLTLSHNPGIAFGIRLPAVFQEVLIIAALVWMTVLAIRSATSLLRRNRLFSGRHVPYFQCGRQLHHDRGLVSSC